MTAPENWGNLFVLVGPGGAGKNALMRGVIDRVEDLKQLATATTRARRENEQHGREHLFVSLEEFQRMIRDGELLEWQEVTRNKFYGIPRSAVEDRLRTGHDLIADIDVLGARILRETYPQNTVLIFITVPGDTEEAILGVLRERMANPDRNENPALIEERIERARKLELPFAAECDHVIVNDDREAATQQLYEIIEATRKKTRMRENA